MAFSVSVNGAAVAVELSGWDRAMNWRRRIEFAAAAIEAVSVADRSTLEPMIDHRTLGWGTHNGSKQPGGRRIGTMLGRDVLGKQFWSVRAGPGSSQMLVLDLADHEFRRAVLEVDDPKSFQSAISEVLGHPGSKAGTPRPTGAPRSAAPPRREGGILSFSGKRRQRPAETKGTPEQA